MDKRKTDKEDGSKKGADKTNKGKPSDAPVRQEGRGRRSFGSLGATNAKAPPPESIEGKRASKPHTPRLPRDEFLSMWRELVQKQRVHEMIKCLQAGKKRMEVLYNFKPDAEFYEFAEQQQAQKREEEAERAEKRKSESAGGADDGRQTNKSQSVMKGPNKGSSEKDNLHDSDIMNAKSKPNVINPKSRNAAELLYNKSTITDQEFEDILELCEDKIEQKVLREAYEEKKARQKYLDNASEGRIMLYDFVNSKFFSNFMLASIIISIVGIFLMTFEEISIRYAYPLIIMDAAIIGVFLVESILKFIIYREDYLKNVWNLVDMLIVAVHFVEIFVDMVTLAFALSSDLNSRFLFRMLKSLRALRLLRVIKFLPNLQVIVTTVFQSMLSIGSIAVLMLLFIFVFAVMGRGLFYEIDPDKFGDLWVSFVTLFQLLTLDDWFDLMKFDQRRGSVEEDVLEISDEVDSVSYWLLFFYLFTYLVMEYFVFLNLFVAVLVDNFQLTLADAEIQKQKEALEELAASQKFEEMKKEGVDPSILEEEHQRQLNEIEQLGMYIEDYFHVDKDSKEAEHLADLYKDMNSIDFERFLWRRRFTLFNMVADTALTARQTTLAAELSDSDSDDDEDDPESAQDLNTKVRQTLMDASGGTKRTIRISKSQ